MADSLHALDFMNEGGYCVNGAMVRLGPELGHWEEVEQFNVGIDPLGNNLLE